jgi:hypothetical protein
MESHNDDRGLLPNTAISIPPANGARVAAIDRIVPPATDVIVLAGRTVVTNQNHLLEPFVGLLTSVEEMATLAAGGIPAGPDEAACIRTAYRALYCFFHVLLPSAGHEVIDGLTYSVALLLVAEAIEVNRVVVPTGGERSDARGQRQEAGSEKSEARSQRKEKHRDGDGGGKNQMDEVYEEKPVGGSGNEKVTREIPPSSSFAPRSSSFVPSAFSLHPSSLPGGRLGQ